MIQFPWDEGDAPEMVTREEYDALLRDIEQREEEAYRKGREDGHDDGFDAGYATALENVKKYGL